MWRRLQRNLEQRMDVIFIAEIALRSNELNKGFVSCYEALLENSFNILF